MPVRRKKSSPEVARDGGRSISLKELAQHLQLSPTTLSLVLNDSPAAASIPQKTRKRILEAASGLGYRPNFLARSLRSQRTYTIGVLVPKLSDGYAGMVMSGIEEYLLKQGYVYLVVSHGHRSELLAEMPRLLYDRCVEGLIGVAAAYDQKLPLPVVTISDHSETPGVRRIVLDHNAAAELALGHLVELGHRDIAVIQGQEFISDARVRWHSIQSVARGMNVPIDPMLVVRLGGDGPSPETGYEAAKMLLASGKPFTALFAFNDISAIGAIRAFRESGRRVPEDISVVGFDDIASAAFHIPALTTIRQPLKQMGSMAAEFLLRRIAEPNASWPDEVQVEPELLVRESTSRAPA